LQSVIKQALLHATGPVLLPEFLPPALLGQDKNATSISADATAWDRLTQYIDQQLELATGSLYADYQALTDRHLLTRVLEKTGGNLSQAARLLGITRTTLRTKLTTLGIATSQSASQDKTND
jgi:two-component system nitrogen regulation response regulator GlnG